MFADGTDERLDDGSLVILRLDARRILVQGSTSCVCTMRAAIWDSVHVHGGVMGASRGIMNILALLHRREVLQVMERKICHCAAGLLRTLMLLRLPCNVQQSSLHRLMRKGHIWHVLVKISSVHGSGTLPRCGLWSDLTERLVKVRAAVVDVLECVWVERVFQRKENVLSYSEMRESTWIRSSHLSLVCRGVDVRRPLW